MRRLPVVALPALRILPALTAGATLLLAGAALAGVSVESNSWSIGINDGPSHKVSAGKTFRCDGSETVGSIGVSVKLRSSIPSGDDWGFTFDGPPQAGDAIPTDEGPSRGGSTLIQTAEVPTLFPKLQKHSVGSFPSGTYTFILEVSGRTAFTQKVTLANCAA